MKCVLKIDKVMRTVCLTACLLLLLGNQEEARAEQHGGDQFKNWPVKPGPWVEGTKGEVRLTLTVMFSGYFSLIS